MTFPASVKPHRPVYPPPIPTAELPDAGGKTPAERAFRTQQAVSDAYSRWRGAHHRDIDMDTLKRNAGAFAHSPVAEQLAPVLDAVADDHQAANKKIQDLIKNARVDNDPGKRAFAQQYWDRKKAVLDSLKEPAKAIAAARDLLAQADDEEVPVLNENLNDYLTSRSLPTGWLPGALATKLPGLADAHADAIVKARQLGMVRQNHAALTNAIKKDLAAPGLLDPGTATAVPYTDHFAD